VVKAPVCVIGLGQLGSAFSSAFLKLGYPVVPVRRGDDVRESCAGELSLILVAVGEDDLSAVLRDIPRDKHSLVVLIQNELRPDQWLKEAGDGQVPMKPSVAIVWFEKKGDKPPHVVLPTVLFGEQSPLIEQALQLMNLPNRRVNSEAELAHELVVKNLYILGLNLTGMKVGGAAGALLKEHQELFASLTDELIELETALLREAARLTGGAPFETTLDSQRLEKDLAAAILADENHGCSGRSAPRRLERTLAHADRVHVEAKRLRELAQ